MNPRDRADLVRGRDLDPIVRAVALDHLVLETPDLATMGRFYEDFGLTIGAESRDAIYVRAADGTHHAIALVRGPRARLRAVALRVEDELALRKLASLPEASKIEERPHPGGGLEVRLVGPDRLEVHAVLGIEQVSPRSLRAPFAMNSSVAKPRVGGALRFAPAPSAVARLGHAVLDSARPVATILWLLRTFGMIVSDYQTVGGGPDDPPVIAFLRFDRGAVPTDHHSLALALGAARGLGHVAFEVADVDEIGIGAAWLASRGWRHAWGIGRHILGSQIFDYWRAPDGTTVEHYADGDVFDASAPTGHLPFRGSNLLQWGPKPPRDFGRPPLSLALLNDAARAISASDEVGVARLLQAVRALSQ